MERTTVYLEEEVALAIRHIAETQKRSRAEIIREALAKYVREAEPRGRQRKIPGAGKHRSGRSDVSEKAERLLRKAARTNR